MKTLAVVRADGDSYISTKCIFTNTYPVLSTNGIVIIDDYLDYNACKNAVHTYFHRNNISLSKLVENAHKPYFIK